MPVFAFASVASLRPSWSTVSSPASVVSEYVFDIPLIVTTIEYATPITGPEEFWNILIFVS